MAVVRLGDVTAASAGSDDLALVAAITDLQLHTVRRKVRDAHGRMLLRNVFARDWPTDPERLGRCNVRLAIDAELETEIAELTNLSERAPSRPLAAAAATAYPLIRRVSGRGGRENGPGKG
jgi:hypothetical protein